MYFTKIKTFCTSKDIIKQVKRQPAEEEKIFAEDLSDKDLLSKIYTEHKLNSDTKKYITNQNICNWFEQTFLQRSYTNGQ